MNLKKQEWFYISQKQLTALTCLEHLKSRESIAHKIRKQPVKVLSEISNGVKSIGYMVKK